MNDECPTGKGWTYGRNTYRDVNSSRRLFFTIHIIIANRKLMAAANQNTETQVSPSSSWVEAIYTGSEVS